MTTWYEANNASNPFGDRDIKKVCVFICCTFSGSIIPVINKPTTPSPSGLLLPYPNPNPKPCYPCYRGSIIPVIPITLS